MIDETTTEDSGKDDPRVGLLAPPDSPCGSPGKDAPMTCWQFMLEAMSHARLLGMIIILAVLLLAFAAKLNSDTMQGLLNIALGAGVSILTTGVANSNNREKESPKKDGGS